MIVHSVSPRARRVLLMVLGPNVPAVVSMEKKSQSFKPGTI